MEFSVNHPILYVLVAVIIAVVLGQSVYFLLKALRRAKAIGMDQKKLRKTMILCGTLMKLPKMKWLSEYALPISLVVGMAVAIPVTGWLS